VAGERSGSRLPLLSFLLFPTLQKAIKTSNPVCGENENLPPLQKNNNITLYNKWRNGLKYLPIWFKELRAEFLPASVLPVLTANALAYYSEKIFDPYIFMLTLLGVVFIHLGTNTANESDLRKNGPCNLSFLLRSRRSRRHSSYN